MDIKVSGKQLKIGKSLINYAEKQLYIIILVKKIGTNS